MIRCPHFFLRQPVPSQNTLFIVVAGVCQFGFPSEHTSGQHGGLLSFGDSHALVDQVCGLPIELGIVRAAPVGAPIAMNTTAQVDELPGERLHRNASGWQKRLCPGILKVGNDGLFDPLAVILYGCLRHFKISNLAGWG